jgi:hypothetical protein
MLRLADSVLLYPGLEDVALRAAVLFLRKRAEIDAEGGLMLTVSDVLSLLRRDGDESARETQERWQAALGSGLLVPLPSPERATTEPRSSHDGATTELERSHDLTTFKPRASMPGARSWHRAGRARLAILSELLETVGPTRTVKPEHVVTTVALSSSSLSRRRRAQRVKPLQETPAPSASSSSSSKTSEEQSRAGEEGPTTTRAAEPSAPGARVGAHVGTETTPPARELTDEERATLVPPEYVTSALPARVNKLVNFLGQEPGTREVKAAWLTRELPRIEVAAFRKPGAEASRAKFNAAVAAETLQWWRTHVKRRGPTVSADDEGARHERARVTMDEELADLKRTATAEQASGEQARAFANYRRTHPRVTPAGEDPDVHKRRAEQRGAPARPTSPPAAPASQQEPRTAPARSSSRGPVPIGAVAPGVVSGFRRPESPDEPESRPRQAPPARPMRPVPKPGARPTPEPEPEPEAPYGDEDEQ